MIIKFNSTGTHVHKDRLKVRLDFYPDPTDKTYAQQYVDKPDTPPPDGLTGEQYEAWWATVPKHKELNPCLCHFMLIDTDITAQKLTKKIKALFPKDTVTAIDSALSDGNMKALQTLMKTRLGSGKVVYGDPSNAINTLLSTVEVEV